MKKDNVVEFRKKDKAQDCVPVIQYTFSCHELMGDLVFDAEAMNRLFSDMVLQDVQLNTLADELFELQLLSEENPEIAQFVSAHIRKFTENMRQKIARN